MAHNSIAVQLKEHSITRRYQAIVHGVIKEEEGTIDAPIGRHPVERKKMSINYDKGKSAVTHYRVLKTFQAVYSRRMQTGNRTYPPDSCSYGQHSSSSFGRRRFMARLNADFRS